MKVGKPAELYSLITPTEQPPNLGIYPALNAFPSLDTLRRLLEGDA
jgi:hypothetical protein